MATSAALIMDGCQDALAPGCRDVPVYIDRDQRLTARRVPRNRVRHGPLCSSRRLGLCLLGLATSSNWNSVDALLVANAFEPYPGYTGSHRVSGLFEVHAEGSMTQRVVYGLFGGDSACRDGARAGINNSCGAHLHNGSGCESAQQIGGHFWSRAVASQEPWNNVTYAGEAEEQWTYAVAASVFTGLSFERAASGAVVVVHDAAGKRIACALLRESSESLVEANLEHAELARCLVQSGWRTREQVKQMDHHGIRNTVIVELNSDGKATIGALQSLSNEELADMCSSDVFSTAEDCYSEEKWRSQGLFDYTGALERCGLDMVCFPGHPDCENVCVHDEDCEGYPMRLCKEVAEQKHRCVHKALFEETAGADVGSAFAFFFISSLALAAGIGGGGLYVPLLMIFLGFTVHEATGLSQALLAGGATSALVYNLRQRHPSGLKPMVDYDLALVMGPNLLIGALAGSALNAAAPSWLILVLLTGILGHSAYKTLTKAFATLKKERAGEVRGMPASGDARLSKNPIERLLRCIFGARYREFDDKDSTPAGDIEQKTAGAPPQLVGVAANELDTQDIALDASSENGTPHQTPASVSQAGVLSTVGDSSGASQEAGNGSSNTSTRAGKNQFPVPRLAAFAAIWALVLACIFLRGGRATPGVVSFCSPGYWLAALFTAAGLGAIGLAAAALAIPDQEALPGASPTDKMDDPSNAELVWTHGSARLIIGWSLLAGTMAALCGIGGGMIMGPKLLDLGVLPQVQSATTATTLFVMSSTTAIAFLVQGIAPFDYAFFLAFATGLGAIFGKVVVGWIVKRFRRPSFIVFLLGGIILTSVIVMAITGLIDVINDIKHGKNLGFKGLCSDTEA